MDGWMDGQMDGCYQLKVKILHTYPICISQCMACHYMVLFETMTKGLPVTLSMGQEAGDP